MHAQALPSMPGHVPIWDNFVVYGSILKISNSMCMSNGNLEFCFWFSLYLGPFGVVLVLIFIAQLGSTLLWPFGFPIALRLDFCHWFQMAFRVQFNFPRFPQLLAGLNNDFRVGHDVCNPQKWTLMNPTSNMDSSLDTANLFTSKNWKMCTTEIGL